MTDWNTVKIIQEYYKKVKIKKGSVLWIKDSNIAGGERHYHVVINNPIFDDVLTVVATSRVEKAKKRKKAFNEPDDSLVVIPPNSHKWLKEETAFQCWSIMKYTPDDVINRLNIIPVEPISKEILEKIINGVLKSNMVEEEIKDKLK
ncbi:MULTISPECIES: hypothetical protein [unclassified Marinitoga]|uniref:hypothetical protein n=1 Tax=unclassified Marinitoga TaxID=2640159 RepID=UPI0009509A1F|nr:MULTISPECIES: hypothetical protein [unclassified Marinitoga]APT75301.1 hypothetical protein LN42_02025 [Marinitoga sp. 1137]NUU96774.1 hypothetical protein [Marinitoga sp. 1138]